MTATIKLGLRQGVLQGTTTQARHREAHIAKVIKPAVLTVDREELTRQEVPIIEVMIEWVRRCVNSLIATMAANLDHHEDQGVSKTIGENHRTTVNILDRRIAGQAHDMAILDHRVNLLIVTTVLNSDHHMAMDAITTTEEDHRADLHTETIVPTSDIDLDQDVTTMTEEDLRRLGTADILGHRHTDRDLGTANLGRPVDLRTVTIVRNSDLDVVPDVIMTTTEEDLLATANTLVHAHKVMVSLVRRVKLQTGTAVLTSDHHADQNVMTTTDEDLLLGDPIVAKTSVHHLGDSTMTSPGISVGQMIVRETVVTTDHAKCVTAPPDRLSV